MTESFEQFIARTSRPAKALPLWVSALVFLSLFFILQMGYGASRGSAFEHFVIGDLTVVPSAALIKLLTPSIPVQALGNQLLAPGGRITVLKGCEGTEITFMLAAVLVGNVLQPVILFLAIVLAWPTARLRRAAVRLVLTVPMIVLLLITKVPLGFVGVLPECPGLPPRHTGNGGGPVGATHPVQDAPTPRLVQHDRTGDSGPVGAKRQPEARCET